MSYAICPYEFEPLSQVPPPPPTGPYRVRQLESPLERMGPGSLPVEVASDEPAPLQAQRPASMAAKRPHPPSPAPAAPAGPSAVPLRDTGPGQPRAEHQQQQQQPPQPPPAPGSPEAPRRPAKMQRRGAAAPATAGGPEPGAQPRPDHPVASAATASSFPPRLEEVPLALRKHGTVAVRQPNGTAAVGNIWEPESAFGVLDSIVNSYFAKPSRRRDLTE